MEENSQPAMAEQDNSSRNGEKNYLRKQLLLNLNQLLRITLMEQSILVSEYRVDSSKFTVNLLNRITTFASLINPTIRASWKYQNEVQWKSEYLCSDYSVDPS